MFSPETLDFLSENRFMNSRAWYQENKHRYEQFVLRPFVELVESLSPTLERIDDRIVTIPKVDKTISRIYRDMRYAKGEYYRDEMWLSFKRDKHMYPCYPEFYFVLSPRGFSYGCGYYAVTAETMQALRKMVLDDHPQFLLAEQAVSENSCFTLHGDCFKRTKYPNADARKRNWLDRKNIYIQVDGEAITDLFSETLPAKTAEDFLSLRPVYEFFLQAEQIANELKPL